MNTFSLRTVLCGSSQTITIVAGNVTGTYAGDGEQAISARLKK